MRLGLFRKQKEPREIRNELDPKQIYWPNYCEICGSVLEERYSQVGAYFLTCPENRYHYEKCLKIVKDFDPKTGKKLI